MVNLVTNSTSLVYNSKISEPVEGSFKGKKLINIDPSFLQKKNFGAGLSDGQTMVLVVLGIVAAATVAVFLGIAIAAHIKGVSFAASLVTVKSQIFTTEALIVVSVVLIARIGAAILFPATK